MRVVMQDDDYSRFVLRLGLPRLPGLGTEDVFHVLNPDATLLYPLCQIHPGPMNQKF